MVCCPPQKAAVVPCAKLVVTEILPHRVGIPTEIGKRVARLVLAKERPKIARIMNIKCYSLKWTAFGIIPTALLVGCSTVKPDHPASLEEYSGDLKKGTATLSGEAFSKTVGGTVKYASGDIVHLDPVTSYSTELFQKLRGHGIFHEEKEKDTVEIDSLMLHYQKLPAHVMTHSPSCNKSQNSSI